ncbi:molybdopterin-guanine dinucleotide biosynthesis protein MobC [Scandinavium lactucae]|uniref:Molybdopterin-guanine dinucleotide biosynthesis protein MobC n=1 Tax=Scandinavium lactucae TaxID=3095028 RepID=A0ABU4QSI4_9ENTR|nr:MULTISPECIES: molybdopterin-guanine dinucleotide biosynthesis protein MobC [unclassified Scandinavium]MDX6041213.1 molybdopterin-guanine dinucleotide biosynthesis protein MobC [Scandinavium sp. V105_6]MDX6049731.1 molybdopterin-guanine dinucleotide biosynthesis protein MobC [Scandinavium sp. V105_1]
MAEKKWYSTEDVELAKSSLADLPDLTPTRLTKTDVLEQLKDKIIELANSKGYSVEDIRSALDSAGIPTSVKAIREILSSGKKSTPRATRHKKVTAAPSDKVPQ